MGDVAKTKSTAGEIASLRDEVRSLRLAVERDQRFERYWRALEVLVQPVSNFGLFALGLSLPMLVGAFEKIGGVRFWSDLIFGAMLMFVALGAIFVPIQLQGYFLNKPTRIKSFFDELERNPNKNPILVMRAWAARQGDAGRGVQAAMAQLDWALRMGFGAMAVALLALLFLYVAALSLLVYVNFQHRPILTAASSILGVVLGLVSVWLYRRRKQRLEAFEHDGRSQARAS